MKGRHEALPSRSTTGAGLVSLAHWRTGWRRLLAWPVGLAALVTAISHNQRLLYPELPARLQYQATIGGSAVSEALNGRGYDLSTLGGITAVEVGFAGLLVLPVVGINLAVSLTRREEDAGRTELLTSGRVGRISPLAGAALTLLASVGLFGLLSWAGLVATGLPAAGSGRYALACALWLLLWSAGGLLAGEVCQGARTATLSALAAGLVVFLVRAVLDGRRSKTVWPSPGNWLAETRPFGDGQLWPFVALALAPVALVAAAVAVALARDLAGGLVAPRRGPATAPRSLTTLPGLTWRLTRGLFAGWMAGAMAWGAALGSLSEEFTQMVRDNPTIREFLGGGPPEQLLTAMSCLLIGVAAAAVAVLGVGCLGAEEDSGRLGLMLSTPTSRGRSWSVWALVISAEALGVLAGGGVAQGLTTAWVTGRWESARSAVDAVGALATPVLAVAAVALALRSLAPRLFPVVWAVVGWALVVGVFGDVLGLPEWSRHMSPFHVVGQVPNEPASAPAVVGFAAVAATLAVIAVARGRERDLRAG